MAVYLIETLYFPREFSVVVPHNMVHKNVTNFNTEL